MPFVDLRTSCAQVFNLFYILCGHFDEKNPGVPYNTGVG